MKDNGFLVTPLNPSGFNAEEIANASPVLSTPLPSPVSSTPLPRVGEYSLANSSKVVCVPS